MNINMLAVCLTLASIVLYPISGWSETITLQTGIASPQSPSEGNNIELLRQRALRNALDLAVLQVTGATVSGDKANSLRTLDSIITDGKQAHEKIDQQSRFNSAVTTRTDGHARLVEIVKEGYEKSGQYYVTAKIAVVSKEETGERNAGYYWRQAGEPSVALFFTKDHDREIQEDDSNRTLLFFRDNIIQNGITVSNSPDIAYRIEILQVLKSSELAEFNTITINCRLSYQLIDTESGKTVAEHRAAHGPNAGFTYEQAQETCIGSIAKEVSENLIREFSKVMNQRLNNGVEQQVIIESMPDGVFPRANEIIQNLYRITTSTPAQYENGRYKKKLTFKGSGTELAEAIHAAFTEEDWVIAVNTVKNGQVRLQWIGKAN